MHHNIFSHHTPAASIGHAILSLLLGSNSSAYVSINNIFDRNPGDLRGFRGIHDVLGRNTLGMRYKL